MNGNPIKISDETPNHGHPLPPNRSVAEIFASEISLGYEERMRKALNLTPYLNFLTDLFSQEVSESSDSEEETPFPILPQQNVYKEDDSKCPAITQAIHTLNINLGESETSPSVDYINQGKAEDISLQFPLPSTSFSQHSSYSSSLTGLSPETSDKDGHHDQGGSELTPISDLELHRYLERPGHGSPVDDIISLLGPTNSDFKPKRPRTWDHQSTTLTPVIESVSVPKQSLNTLTVAGFEASGVLNSENILLGIPNTDVKDASLKLKVDPEKGVNENFGHFRGCMKNTSSSDKLNLNQTANFEREENEVGCEEVADIKVHGAIDEEDDSLSDYMNITANTSLALDSYFKFDAEELTSSAQSPCSPSTGSLLPLSSSIKFENQMEIMDDDRNVEKLIPSTSIGGTVKKDKISVQKQTKLIHLLNLKRRKIYVHICKKEVPKAFRIRRQTFLDTQAQRNGLALMCAKHLQQEASQSQKLKKLLKKMEDVFDPFVLKREKKLTKDELSMHMEVFIPCQLTSLQRSQYSGIKKKIQVEDLAKSFRSPNLALKETTKLMTLVLDLRKVCNHPDLLQKRDVISPFYMEKMTEVLPSIMLEEAFELWNFDFTKMGLDNFNIFDPVHSEMMTGNLDAKMDSSNNSRVLVKSEWSFTRLIGLNPWELFKLTSDISKLWTYILNMNQLLEAIWRHRIWKELHSPTLFLRTEDFVIFPNMFTSFPNVSNSSVFKDLVFVSYDECFHGFVDEKMYSSNSSKLDTESGSVSYSIRQFGRSPLPYFFNQYYTKVLSPGRSLTCLKRYKQKIKSYNSELLRSVLEKEVENRFYSELCNGLEKSRPPNGWSQIVIPSRDSVILDSGKLRVLDKLLKNFIREGRKIVLFSCMARMMNVIEEHLIYRNWKFERLLVYSSANDRQRVINKFEKDSDLQILLLPTKAAGIWGLNLNAADTIIFHDSDMTPGVDEQAMDLSFSTKKKLNVYKLVIEDTIEQKVLQRATIPTQFSSVVESHSSSPSGIAKLKDILTLLFDTHELDQLDCLNVNLESKSSCPKRICSPLPTNILRDKALGKKFNEAEASPSVGSSTSATESSSNSEMYGGGDDDFEFFDEEDEFESEEDEVIKAFDDIDCVDGPVPSTSNSQFSSDWKTSECLVSEDYDEESGNLVSRQKLIRGRGRGRPPLRVRVKSREDDGSRRGRPVGRPRLKRIGPLNHGSGVRGRKPGRPPLSKKAETSMTCFVIPDENLISTTMELSKTEDDPV